MSAQWPHVPADLHVGDVFIAKSSRTPVEVTVKSRRNVDDGVLIGVEGRPSELFYESGTPIRIIGRSR
jgi:hypothetical protein